VVILNNEKTSKTVKTIYKNIKYTTNILAFSLSITMYKIATAEYKINFRKVTSIILRENLPISFEANRS
jgi:hypothetical protein